MTTVEVTGRTFIEALYLPKSKPPVLLADWPGPGEHTLLINTDTKGEAPDAPDHLQRHGFEVMGPFTPDELAAALVATGQRCRVHDASYAASAALAEIAGKVREAVAGLSADDISEVLLMAQVPR